MEDWKEELGLCICDDFDLWVISVARIGQILSCKFPRSTLICSTRSSLTSSCSASEDGTRILSAFDDGDGGGW